MNLILAGDPNSGLGMGGAGAALGGAGAGAHGGMGGQGNPPGSIRVT
jgi:hypothetical protein